MLKRFEVRNYKNFQDTITVDFTKLGGYRFNQACLADGLLGKMIIYGRNATGKTNLGWAFFDIYSNFFGVRRLLSPFLNVDSDEKTALFKYEFEFDGKSVVYEYQKATEKILTKESLRINNCGIFKIDFENKKYDISGLKTIQAETLVFERYEQMLKDDPDREGPIPFIRWILANTALSSNSILLKLNNFVKGMNFVSVGSNISYRPRGMEDSFLDFLDEDNHINDLTEFLNLMGIQCKLVIIKSPDGSKNLYFDNKKPIPFWGNASSGTLALYKFYQRITMATYTSTFVYMDEFDAFYHYEMAENIVKYIMKKYPDCQMIMTTHNTNLMTNRLMRPDCLFILSQTGKLTALCNATQRELREGHNLEKMYISGEFEKYE